VITSIRCLSRDIVTSALISLQHLQESRNVEISSFRGKNDRSSAGVPEIAGILREDPP